MLIEVMISALLVALIVVGTLNGFDAADKAGADERNHDEATVLANESQEILRSDPATTFDTAKNNYEHVYTKKINGTTFTVTQTASFLNGSGEGVACSALNTSRQEANEIRITSTVSWALQKAAKRTAVTESSTSTPPAGSALEVDVGNYPTPTAGVAGATAVITYTPFESTGTNTLEGTTEGSGCVTFSSLPSTAANVELDEKVGYVVPSGSTKFGPKEVAIAPNHTTHEEIAFNEGGAIKAEFTFKGATEYENKNNNNKTFKEHVTGDTFVAYNELMEEPPYFEVGSTKGSFSAGDYKVEPGTYQNTATSPIESVKYPNGNLFPFPEPNAWQVYSGACPENEPSKPSSAYVLPGKTTAVAVPMAYVKLNVYTGTTGTPGGLQETTAYPIKITNTECDKVTPDNGVEFNEPKEEQKQTVATSSPEYNAATMPAEYGGHLEHPFLPFGPGKLCLAYNTTGGSAVHRTYTTEYTLSAEEEYTRSIYLKESATKYTATVKRQPSNTSETETVNIASSGSTIKCS